VNKRQKQASLRRKPLKKSSKPNKEMKWTNKKEFECNANGGSPCHKHRIYSKKKCYKSQIQNHYQKGCSIIVMQYLLKSPLHSHTRKGKTIFKIPISKTTYAYWADSLVLDQLKHWSICFSQKLMKSHNASRVKHSSLDKYDFLIFFFKNVTTRHDKSFCLCYLKL